MKKFKFKSVVSLASMKLSVKSAAILLASSTLVSALLGLFRDRLLNSYYLDTYPTGIDAYTAAFTIPDFMFFILTSGALAVSFIPVFNQRLVNGNKKSAWELTSSLLNLMAILTFIASILIMIFAEPLVKYVVGPGLDESGTILAVNMMRVIAVNPLLFSISTIICSIQQAVGRFVFYALAPTLYNIGILIGITCFTGGINLFGVQVFEGGIMGVALGVVLGAVLQVLMSLVGLFGLGFDYEFKIHWKNQGFRTILKLLPARSAAQGMDYVDDIVCGNLASRMEAGALRSFQQGNSLHNMPISLIGVAISTAFFPQMTEETGRGETEHFHRTFRTALRTIVWISLPVAAITFFSRGYVASFIKNGGAMSIAGVLGGFAIAIFARSVYHIVARGFYAMQDTKTPLLVSIVSVLASIAFAIIFFSLGFNVAWLGLAQSIGTILEIIILLIIFQIRSKGKFLNSSFWKAFFRMLFATAITGCVAYSMTKFFPLLSTDDSFTSTFPKFCLICVASLGAYVIASYFLNLDEVKPIIEKLKKIIFRNAK